MSVFSDAFRRASLAIAAIACLEATSASACECSGGGYASSYYRDYDDSYGYGNYSCYGGGYACGYERSYYRPYYHRHYHGYDGYDRHRYYYDRRHERDCYRDCR
jgi:hypothetical protein